MSERPPDALAMVRDWCEQESWAHAKCWGALRALPELSRGDARFQRAVDKVVHIAEARAVWLWRVGARAERPTNIFPDGMTLDEGERLDVRSMETWRGFVEGLDVGGLSREVRYQSLDGASWSNSVLEICTHVWSHGFYHRGQVGLLVNAMGGTPAGADYILHARARGSR
ncbi:MAG: hypothetical protein EA378_06575 [Phycisphaerales bacterium]|nr:MAG: hypothetical protein EA378_06575 [Phycisphaerales bacterium]